MKYGINECHFIGRLGKDPENFEKVCKFSIAVTEKWKTGDHTEWIPCAAFGKLKDICAEILQKGDAVYISGKWSTSSWEKDGQKHYSTELIAGEMRKLTERAKEPAHDPQDKTPGESNIPF